MGVSPSQAKSRKGDHVFPEESTSEQSHEIGNEFLLTELSEDKNQRGRALTQNTSTEIATGKTLEHNKLEESSTWVCGLPAKQSNLSSKVSAETTVSFGPENICKKLSELPKQGQQLDSHIEHQNTNIDGKTSKIIGKNYILRSLASNDKDFPPSSLEKSKPSESGNNVIGVGSTEKRKRRKKKREQREVVDEYSRIRAHLRYLLNRINYERSSIAAYSTEGWKGLSIEKLKPNKELQRATSEIHRRKLKIRDLFQRIDSLCAEGRLPESLFDFEGQIDSEDIFCAKCGSKDVSPNNDIILCDGDCDRGFHQYCLQPPLSKEDIPPDDEGWLCPGCDCKVDCIELLNQSQGTNFSLTENWENIFSEAVVSADGENLDPNFGLQLDDFNDYDHNSDNLETGEKIQGDDSSFDPEDDDFDPDDSQNDNVSNHESSSFDFTSGFTSDSDDLGDMLEDDISSQKNEDPLSSSASKGSKKRKSKKRSNERLDYKKLYDETYGNIPSSSSDDEDWSYSTALRKRMKCFVEASSVPSNGNASELGGESICCSSDKKPGSSTHKRLGEAVKQRLYKSFNENQYPDRSAKESMAKELDITFEQVNKWFDNARSNLNNSSSFREATPEKVAENDIPSAPETKN